MKNLQKIFSQGFREVLSAKAMIRLGQELADCLEGGEILGLVGQLGAGKTHLVQGILMGLGASQPGASPTFSLVHEHPDGRIPLVHFDFYRMKSPEEAYGIGWDEYLAGDAILLVEWADRFDGSLMPPDTQWLLLEHTGEHSRRVSLAG